MPSSATSPPPSNTHVPRKGMGMLLYYGRYRRAWGVARILPAPLDKHIGWRCRGCVGQAQCLHQAAAFMVAGPDGPVHATLPAAH